jgi:hypothetical protein
MDTDSSVDYGYEDRKISSECEEIMVSIDRNRLPFL